MISSDEYNNPYFDTSFDAFNVDYGKYENEFEYNNQQAWLDRMYQTWEREQTQAYNLEMWNLNNEYNSIGSQMERARAAGVNPASIAGGEYKSAQSTAPQSTPTGKAQASVSGTQGLLQQGLQGVADTANEFAGLLLERKQIDSNIEVNKKNLVAIAEKAGLDSANAESIRTATRWIDGRSVADIRATLAKEVNLYNDSQEKLKSIEERESNIAVNESTIELNHEKAETERTIQNVNKETAEGLDIDNQYKDEINQNVVEEGDLRVWEQNYRKEFAKLIEMPLGSSDFEFNYGLHKKGKFGEFYNYVTIPNERATWKVGDYIIPYSKDFTSDYIYKVLGVPLGGEVTTKEAGYLNFLKMMPQGMRYLPNPTLNN